MFRGNVAQSNVVAINGDSSFCLAAAAQVGNSSIDMIYWESAAFLRAKDRLILRLQFAEVVKFTRHFDTRFKGRVRDGPISQRRPHLVAPEVPHGHDMITVLLWAEPAGGSATVSQRFHPR